jgi:hypothetical protein
MLGIDVQLAVFAVEWSGGSTEESCIGQLSSCIPAQEFYAKWHCMNYRRRRDNPTIHICTKLSYLFYPTLSYFIYPPVLPIQPPPSKHLHLDLDINLQHIPKRRTLIPQIAQLLPRQPLRALHLPALIHTRIPDP